MPLRVNKRYQNKSLNSGMFNILGKHIINWSQVYVLIYAKTNVIHSYKHLRIPESVNDCKMHVGTQIRVTHGVKRGGLDVARYG